MTLAAFLLWWPTRVWPVSTLDEAILLVYPARMASGDLPYKDFFAAYGPAFWWTLHAWYALLGIGLTSMRLLGLALHVAVALGVYALVRRHGTGVATTCAMLVVLLLFRLGGNPYAWVAIAALCLWQLALLPDRAVLAGVFGGLAMATRPDVALMVLVPGVILARGRRGRWLTGLTLGLVPVFVSVVLSPRGLIDDVFLGRAGRGAAQSRLPLPPLAAPDRRLLAMLLVSVLLMAVLAWLLRTRHAIALALLAVLAAPQALQRADYTHFVYAGLFSLPFLPLVGSLVLERMPRQPYRAHLLGALAGVAAFVVAVPEIPRNITDMTLNGNMRHAALTHDGRTLWEAPARAEALNQLFERLDQQTRPGDGLFVFDANLVRPAVNDVSLYWYLPRLRQRAFHMEITPGITSRSGSGLVRDLMAARWVILVDTPESERRTLFPYAHDGSAEARTALAEHFCKRFTVDRYEVWERCA